MRKPWGSAALLQICRLVCLAVPVGTAQAQTVDDTGVWTALFARGDIAEEATDGRLKWWFDGHARFFDDTDGFGQSIVRPGIGYQWGDTATLWAGYGWIRTSPGLADEFDEHRAWQQLTWSEPFGSATLGFRSRLEQRFLETGSETGWRFRQLVSFRRPFSCNDRLTLVAWDECFFHLNDTDWGADAGFDQNRVFLGVGRLCNSTGGQRVEIGYLNQFIGRPGLGDLSNHLLSVNFYWSP